MRSCDPHFGGGCDQRRFDVGVERHRPGFSQHCRGADFGRRVIKGERVSGV
ncbi:hypothetical protein [Mesorhizobium sp. J8]|uniref:hypothetical protein n=1 Tax=Mesorhizobium sp. J8 TaxID=2777475 RepID=UPI0019163897|nr:hypothetical protein [Mesorhizobium sp. J8]